MPTKRKMLQPYAYEFLLLALFNFIFNRIFFTEGDFYIRFVWPFNIVVLGIASVLIFREGSFLLKWLKNILFLAVVSVPFFSKVVFSNSVLSVIGISSYILFYVVIFVEILRQITRKSKVNASVVLGSLSGYLLLAVIATFSFILVDYNFGDTLSGVSGTTVPERYSSISYFSLITLTTIGYGEITPIHESARLLAGFWGVLGQFYMVALVGIIISKYNQD